jgi:hypothetical protein
MIIETNLRHRILVNTEIGVGLSRAPGPATHSHRWRESKGEEEAQR